MPAIDSGPSRQIPFVISKDLSRMFLTQFMAGRVRRKPSGSLMSLHQGPEESLRDFFMRFNQARLEAEAATDDFIYGALFQGIRKDGALMADIARKPPSEFRWLYE